MDTKSKIIFLREVLARKVDLFSKTDSKHKDEMDAEYLRRTTYQNLQRRAKEKYEKGLKIGMEHINLSEVDELILDIIGRDKCTPAPDILNDDNLQTLLGFITKNDPHSNGIQFNKADSLHNSSPYSIHDSDEKQNGYMKSNSPMMNGHAQSPANESVMELHPKLPEVITSLFQSFATNNPPTTTTTQNSFNLSQNNMKRKRPNTDDPIDDDSLDDIDEQKLKKRKLHAEIRLLNAQVLVQEREATLKDLQIMALKRELDLPPTAQSAQNRSFSKEDV